MYCAEILLVVKVTQKGIKEQIEDKKPKGLAAVSEILASVERSLRRV